jgi:hypothetical protein
MSHTSNEYDELDGLLQRWGAWQERHCEDVVLPRQAAFCMIVSDQPPGPRILCGDMARDVQELQVAFLMLRLRPQKALYLWYAVQLKEGGGYWSPDEKAELFGCSLNALRCRVTRARRVLQRKYNLVLQAKALQKRQFSGNHMAPWTIAPAGAS